MTRRTRVLPIHLWWSLTLAAVIVIPALVAWGLDSGLSAWQQQQARSALAAAKSLVGGDVTMWRNPDWQAHARARLAALGVAARLDAPDGSPLFASGVIPISVKQKPAAEGTVAKIPFWPPGSRAGQGYLAYLIASQPDAEAILAESLGGAFVAVLVLLLIGGWALRRAVARPLTAMGQAARGIASGYLDVRLPGSSVREVADASSAMETMAAGLREAIQHQADLEQERRLFVGAIAHDLRTPLFTLSGYLAGLREGVAATPEKALHYVEVCQEQAAALERLVADLFAYTRLEYLELEPQRQPLDLAALLCHVADSMAPRAEANAITLGVTGAPEPAVVMGDSQLLTRVVENLLDNALRYTPPGGRIDLCWMARADRFTFTVEDTGPGIDAHDLPHLFTPLYRGETSRSRQTGGAGLGLTIAQRIVHAHGGSITAANRETGGAAFTVTVRLIPVQFR